jgi:phospholipid/cholesterol/gamma-HCH transport system ATP-binding protein
MAEALLSVRNLCSTLGGRQILDQVSFEVQPGEILGVMGLSGAGKSTLLKNIMGLLRPQSGEIIIEGANIIGLPEARLNLVRAKMGMCFQYAALFDSLSVFENVAFGLRRQRRPEGEIRQRVLHYLDVVGMGGTEHQMPASLSGGMRKRVGIARALVTEPQLILYDEPTSGLDPVLAASIDALIARLRDQFGMASVVVTHDVDHLFTYANRALMLYESRVIECDSPAALKVSANPVVQQFIHGLVEGPIQVQ